mmetsp:Transcript_118990/g.229537  ORF Transcript_118990/g.229537 Transcript_118990/m.229537 type:complete len:203 (-) Transcript_118990:266-874(-)
MLVKSLTLRFHKLLRTFFGISTRGASILLEVHFHPLTSHRFNLIMYVAHVPCTHYGAHGSGRPNSSQTCNTTSQDESVRWWELTCSCHLTRVEASERMSSLEHSTVAGALCLGAENIELLRNGNARHRGDIQQCDVGHASLLNDLLACILEPTNPRNHHLSSQGVEVIHRSVNAKEDAALLQQVIMREDLAANVRVCHVAER